MMTKSVSQWEEHVNHSIIVKMETTLVWVCIEASFDDYRRVIYLSEMSLYIE